MPGRLWHWGKVAFEKWWLLEGLGWEVTWLPVDAAGRVRDEDLVSAVGPGTALVTLMHANNETGTIQPIREASKAALAVGALVHADAAQSVGKVPVRVDDLGVDLLSIAGHKLYAPKGVGALYMRSGTPIGPVIRGAGHERGLRVWAARRCRRILSGFGSRFGRLRVTILARSAQHACMTTARPHIAMFVLLSLGSASACGQWDPAEAPGADAAGGPEDIQGATTTPQAMALEPAQINFQAVKAGDTAIATFKITNVGQVPLEVRQVSVSGNKVFELRLKGADGEQVSLRAGSGEPLNVQPPIVVAVGESHDGEVVFAPTDGMTKVGTVFIDSGDPDAEDGTLALSGNSELPCMALHPVGKMKFGAVKVGSSATRAVEIGNCGGTTLLINAVSIDDGPDAGEFKLDLGETLARHPELDPMGPSQDKPWKIDVNQAMTFPVVYSPSKLSQLDMGSGLLKPDVAKVRVQAHVASQKDTIAAEGFGVAKVCPTAKIVSFEGEEVIPKTVLHLSGDQSVGVAGAAVKKFLWSATQPTGSNQSFVPGATFPNPSFTAEASGSYKICLRVWDEFDAESCQPACVTVVVMPEDGIQVELLWTTPGDPNETDTGPAAGSDLNLHFAHPDASGEDLDCDGEGDPWFSNPFDAFWFNHQPKWGSTDPAVDDDPQLELDDTDGAGPELTTLGAPQGSVEAPFAYDVGVHYWNDHDYGPSYAKVNIYIMGVLTVQIANVQLHDQDMWHVGRINWPNTFTGGPLPPFTTCYKTAGGDPCKKTGKFWQEQGDWCVTKCYGGPFYSAAGVGKVCLP